MRYDYKSSFYNIYRERQNDDYVIFNSFTKAEVIFEKELFNYIKDENFSKIDSATMKELLNLGFIVKKELNEFEIIKDNYIKYRSKKDTLLITLVPTFMCNFRCRYCFEGSKQKENLKIIDFNVLKKYAKLNFNNYKHIHITLFGGEPLLCFDKSLDFYRYVKQLCETNNQTYSSSIATNAFLLNEENIKKLIEVCNCQTFQITIDGCKRTHNMLRCLPNGQETFDKVLNNFKMLLKYNYYKKLNIVLRVNLFNNTIEEVEQFLEEFSDEEKEKFSIYFRNIYNTKEFKEKNKNENNLADFYNIAINKNFIINGNRKFSFYHCEGDGGEEQLHILPDLKVYKCINDMSFEKSYIGKINSDGEIVFNDNIHIWNDCSFFEDEKCRNCKYMPMCWGGCPLIFKKTNKRICIHEKIMDEMEKRKENINA